MGKYQQIALLLATLSTAGSFELSSGRVEIDVGEYRSISFCVDIAQQEGTAITGSLSVEPDTLRVELMLFHSDDFQRWRAGLGAVDTLYLGRAGSGPVSIPVEGFGDMVLVLSNRGNWDRAVLMTDLRLAFEGDGVPYNPLLTGSRIVLVLLAGGVTAAFLAGLVLHGLRARRSRAGRSAP